jgi:ferredoxin-NADP reductase
VVWQVRNEATGIVSLTLGPASGPELPPWSPGAHLDLVLPSGRIRQYSLCGDLDDRSSYTVAVLRDEAGRGGSIELHEAAAVGRTMTARGPRNRFELVPADHYVFLAGGIGITPILAMIRRVVGIGGDWALHYGARTRSHFAFADDLGRLGGARVHLVPHDVDGVLDLARVLGDARTGAAVYACGPAAMLHAVEETCRVQSLDLHLERFGPSLPETSSPERGRMDPRSFTVELRRTGVTVNVAPDQSLLEAIRSVVPYIPFSCEQGYCGTCETRVLDGLPEHNDDILTNAQRRANDAMFICVSRSLTPTLVLDL